MQVTAEATKIDAIEVVPTTPGLGAELVGADIAGLAGSEEGVGLLHRLLDRHLVLLARRQELAPGTMTELVATWGPLLDIRRPFNDAQHVPGHDKIKVISNALGDDGRPLGDGNSSAQIWHSDSTPWEVPPGHIAFYCRVAPTPPPTTSFLDMIAVHEELPAELQARIAPLRVIHHQYPRQIEVEIARTGASLPLEERGTGRVHPLVRRHLPTGKPLLYLPTRHDSLVVGWSEEESHALFDELWSYANASPATVGYALEPGDFVVWDNAALTHSREGWPEDVARVMWHVCCEGESPTPMYSQETPNVSGMTEEQRQEAARAMRSDY
jgi:alpha-ketoglutarate-dependent taurine dioxygenase